MNSINADPGNAVTVDFPGPEGPTMATHSPSAIDVFENGCISAFGIGKSDVILVRPTSLDIEHL
jgi:hypothetical protein